MKNGNSDMKKQILYLRKKLSIKKKRKENNKKYIYDKNSNKFSETETVHDNDEDTITKEHSK